MSICYRNGAYIADTARVLGEVELGRDVNIWYGALVRGDVAKIVIGQGTNVQDNAVIHCDYDLPNIIGSNVTIGHGAIIHGERVGNGTLIGMGAILLGQTKIGKHCIIAAGSVVTPGFNVADGNVVMGIPGKIVRRTTKEEQESLRTMPLRYVHSAKLHYENPDAPRIQPWGHSL